MMWRRMIPAAMVVLLVASIPCQALAVSWPLSQTMDPSLAYAEEYVRPDGTTVTHSGVDIPGEAGESVLSVAEGTVSFAGRIPGMDGGSILAVTIESPTGDKWSFMPLAELSVVSGDTLEAGDPLGTLASTGDPSSEETHLHVGLRRGELYVDPLSQMDIPSAGLEPEPEPAPLEVPVDLPAESPVVAVSEVEATHIELPGGEEISAEGVEAAMVSVVDAVEVKPQNHSLTAGTNEALLPEEQNAAQTDATTVFVEAEKVQEPSSEQGRVAKAEFVQTHVVQAPSASSVFSLSGTAGSLIEWRLALAVFCLGPLVCSVLFRRFRSRVTASGDAVAAVVGR